MSWSGQQGQINPQAPADVQNLRNQMAAWLAVPGQGTNAQTGPRIFDITRPPPPTTNGLPWGAIPQINGTVFGGAPTGSQGAGSGWQGTPTTTPTGGPTGYPTSPSPTAPTYPYPSFNQPGLLPPKDKAAPTPTAYPTMPTGGGTPSTAYDPTAWAAAQTTGGLTPTADWAEQVRQASLSTNWFTPGGYTPSGVSPGSYSTNPQQALANAMLPANDPRLWTGGLYGNVPGGTGGLTPATAGFSSMTANPGTISANVVQSPWGPIDVPDVNGQPVTQGTGPALPPGFNPMAVPPGTTPWVPGTPMPFPIDAIPPYAQPGGGGPVAGGGPTGTGPPTDYGGQGPPGTYNGPPGDFRGMFTSPTEIARTTLGPAAQVGALRDVSSVDQLGGQNSAFFQNMMAQLSPAFAQRRAEGLAAAKESAGNLTGSGFANSLGSSINRSLGEEQARLADYATQGMNMELGRQLQMAGLDLNRGQFNAGAQNQFGLAQGNMDQSANIYNSSAANQANQFNAQNFQQMLMAMLTGGVGNPQATYTPGLGDFFGQLLGNLPFAWNPR